MLRKKLETLDLVFPVARVIGASTVSETYF